MSKIAKIKIKDSNDATTNLGHHLADHSPLSILQSRLMGNELSGGGGGDRDDDTTS